MLPDHLIGSGVADLAGEPILLGTAKLQKAAQGGGVILLPMPDEGELTGEATGQGQGHQTAGLQPIRHRQVGNEGDAKPLLDRQHHRLQGVEFEPRLPARQFRLDLLLELFAAAGLGLSQYPGLIAQLGEGETAAAGEGVSGLGHDQHLVVEPGLADQVRVVVLPLDQRQIQLEVGQQVAELVGIGDGDAGRLPQFLLAGGEQGRNR